VDVDEWFSEVRRKLERATDVHIYLRAFLHPDEAREDRKNEIINMMRSFARIIYEHPSQIKIVAYSTKSTKKDSTKKWLYDDIHNKYAGSGLKALIGKEIVVDKQPDQCVMHYYQFGKTDCASS